MQKKYFLLILLFLFFSPLITAQQILDSSNVIFVDQTSDGNTGATGTFMNDPRYKEFTQTATTDPNVLGWWSNISAVYHGGNSRRASRYGSGNNTGAHAKFFCTVWENKNYLVYHHMNSGNSSTRSYVTFHRFGEGLPADSFLYNMRENQVYYDIRKDGSLVEFERGSWYPLGSLELYAADSSLTVTIGLDSTGTNTLRTDAVLLLKSSQTGPDLEFGARKFDVVTTDPGTGDTLVNHSFFRDRAPFQFPQTTFKYNKFTDKSLVLYNLGTLPLTVTGFATGTTRYSVETPTPIVIPVGGKYPIVVRFSPKGEETTLDTLVIFSNDALEPEAKMPLVGTGINYNFILNASLTGAEPHWNVPSPGGLFDLIGTSWANSTATPWTYPIPGGNNNSVVNVGSDPAISATYRFEVPDSLFGSYFIEHAGPAGSSNAAQQVTVDVVTPFYSNPNPALGDTQRVLGFNSRLSVSNRPWVRIGGNLVFQLNGGGQTTVRFTNPSQGGTELLRADLLRVRLVPIAPTVSTSLDPARLLNFGSVSIYDSIRQIQFNFQRNFEIGSNGETPLRIDSIWIKNGTFMTVDNMPSFPLNLPAIDGKYNLLVSFLPDQITAFSDSIWIKSNDPVDSLILVRISGQGVGTGIVVDDTDPTNFIFPADIVDWTGAPDPLMMDKWYRISGSGTNNTRMISYIYFNPPDGLQKIEWYPFFPFRPGTSEPEVDTFDVYVQLSISSSISSPQAKYVINHVGENSPDIKIINQNGLTGTGRVFLGRYPFLRGGQDYHGSGGTIFGSVELHNDTALVSAFYPPDSINIARRDSFVLRADAVIFEEATLTSIIAEPNMTPETFSLSQNYPNPFNPTTQIKFQLPIDSRVDLRIYDILGREVATLLSDDLKTGYYTTEWNGRNNSGVMVSSGIYIYRIVAGKFVQTKKMMMLK
ncbi:MAG: T9SS type A sorting domain-containing protein [Ignavibacteriaceae bacterium]